MTEWTPPSTDDSLDLVEEALRLWDTLEDTTRHWVGTYDIVGRNRRLWEAAAPRLRAIAGILASDLETVAPGTVNSLVYFLQHDPPNTEGRDGIIIHGRVRTGLIKLQGALRERKRKQMNAQRMAVLRYLARAREQRPYEGIEASELAEKLAITADRADIYLQQLANEGAVDYLGGHGPGAATINAEGLRLLEEGPKHPQLALVVNNLIAGNNYGNVAVGDNLVQHTGLHEDLAPLIEQFLELVQQFNAPPAEKDDLKLEAAQLLAEAQKTKPDGARLHGIVTNLRTFVDGFIIAQFTGEHGPAALALLEQISHHIRNLR